MTFEEAMTLGVELARERRFDEALTIVHQVQQVFPDNPQTHRVIGQLLRAKGEMRAAVPYLAEALSRNRDADSVYDLATVFFALKAVAELDRLCGQYRPVVWDDARVLLFWGYSLTTLRTYGAALGVLRRAHELCPEDRTIRQNFAAALMGNGRAEEAVEMFSSICGPWDGQVVTPMDVAKLDVMADGYDQNELHQFFGRRLMRLYADAFGNRSLGRVLELGCGSGLVATVLPGAVPHLTGIDRSSAMLEQARCRNRYNTLIQGDLPDAMTEVVGPVETFLASGVLCYFADMEPFFRHASRLLSPGGVFTFSVDPMTDACDIGVSVPGEFAHSRAYLRRLAGEAGLSEVAIEIDRHRGPPGFWCVFCKTLSPT